MNKLVKHKVIFHILFWIFIFCFVFDYFYEGFLTVSQTSAKAFFECLIYASISYTNLLVLIPFFQKHQKVWGYILSLILFLTVLLIPYHVFDLGYYFLGPSPFRSNLSFTLNYILFIIISFFYWYLIRYNEERHNLILLKNDKLQTELNLLKSQISPHFLFNSLNNIYSLSVTKSDAAPEMIEKLSDILRYLLDEGHKDSVPLQREADLIQQYIDLQRLKKVKAEDHISYHISGVKPHHSIQPLILVNFIENAFKHSDIQYNKDGFLKVNLHVDNDKTILFEIENSTNKAMESLGIGLGNVKKQLTLYYGNSFNLNIANTSNDSGKIATFKVTLILPVNDTKNS